MKDKIDVPFGAHDSELKYWEYTIPEGMEAVIKDGKVIMRENEDERIRKVIGLALTDVPEERFASLGTTLKDCLDYLEKQKEEEGYGAIPVESTLEYKLGFKAGKESEKQKEQKSIEDVVKDMTKNKETATKFLKSAGIMDENGELAEMYRSEKSKSTNSEKPKEWKFSVEDETIIMSPYEAEFCQKFCGHALDHYSPEGWKIIKNDYAEFKEIVMRELAEQKHVLYSPLCNTIKDKIQEYVANHFVTDTVVKTDIKSIVKAMEEGVRLGREEQKPTEWSVEDEKMVRFYEKDYDNNLGNMPTCDVIENRLKFKDWLLNRLKYIRPFCKLSEEDEKILHAIEFYVDQLDNIEFYADQLDDGKTINRFSVSDMLRVLKSLHH